MPPGRAGQLETLPAHPQNNDFSKLGGTLAYPLGPRPMAITSKLAHARFVCQSYSVPVPADPLGPCFCLQKHIATCCRRQTMCVCVCAVFLLKGRGAIANGTTVCWRVGPRDGGLAEPTSVFLRCRWLWHDRPAKDFAPVRVGTRNN